MPFSTGFRAQYVKMVSEFREKPLIPKTFEEKYPEFTSDAYAFTSDRGVTKTFHDIYSLIRYKNAIRQQPNDIVLPNHLSVSLAVKLLKKFLEGSFYGDSLIRLRGFFSRQLNRAEFNNFSIYERSLFKGIHDIIKCSESDKTELMAKVNLIDAIQKITDFVIDTKDVSEETQVDMMPLLYSKNFRNLFHFATFIYCRHSDQMFADEVNCQKKAYETSKEYLSDLRDRLAGRQYGEGVSLLVQAAKMFYGFEKVVYEANSRNHTVAKLRDLAFGCIDWFPILSEYGNPQIMVHANIILARIFLNISRQEINPAYKMADERIAFNLLISSFQIGMKFGPDVEMYANYQLMRVLANFEYKDPLDLRNLEAIRKRTETISDVMPFYNGLQDITTLLKQQKRSLPLMRKLLNRMMTMLQENKKEDSVFQDTEHSKTAILYQAYEACLKNWFKETFNAEEERAIRIELMNELLFEQGWSVLDIEENIGSPWVFVDRDDAGWMRPVASLPYKNDPAYTQYRTFNGIEINNNTGDIKFLLEPWRSDRSDYEKAFMMHDLQEMLERGLGPALFSLDPVDPNMPYHPFNTMRYGPEQLADTELFNSMLLTDYMLKFLTVGQEVQGEHPFDQRSSLEMISHLPAYLQKIITDFREADKPVQSLHRFWIEALEVDIKHRQADKNDSREYFAIDDIKMVVKKHKMIRDANGELKDTDNDDEGWPIYVLTHRQFLALEQGHRSLDGHAMIFIKDKFKLCYWEDNVVIKTHQLSKATPVLARLFGLSRDENGLVKFDYNHLSVFYEATKAMADQAGMPHRYSPEFIFATEFSLHYNEFAQYLPEFGRLRELTKISVLVGQLYEKQISIKENIRSLDYLLDGIGTKPKSEIFKLYQTDYNATLSRARNMLQKNLSTKLAIDASYREIQADLTDMKQKIGKVYLDSNSPEVINEAQRIRSELTRQNPGVPAWRIEQEINCRSIAKEISNAKYSGYYKQLKDIYQSRLSECYASNEISDFFNSFLANNLEPLATAIYNVQKRQFDRSLEDAYSHSSRQTIHKAFETRGNTFEQTQLIKAQVESSFSTLRAKLNTSKQGLEAIHLGEDASYKAHENSCFWVPASVNHTPPTESGNRYSFFCYGGVSLQPKVNTVATTTKPAGTEKVGNDRLNKKTETVLYQKLGPNGEHLKFGITKNPDTRYTASQLNGGRLKILARGPRAEMLQLERNMHSTLPIGPEERQKCYIDIQAKKGYRTPPY